MTIFYFWILKYKYFTPPCNKITVPKDTGSIFSKVHQGLE